MRILAINPGSTSTKIAVYEDENPVFEQTIRHQTEELAPFPTLPDQYDFRKQIVLKTLKECAFGFQGYRGTRRIDQTHSRRSF